MHIVRRRCFKRRLRASLGLAPLNMSKPKEREVVHAPPKPSGPSAAEVTARLKEAKEQRSIQQRLAATKTLGEKDDEEGKSAATAPCPSSLPSS